MANQRRDRTKEKSWRQHVAQWRRSGLTIRAYCRRQGLPEPSFHAWRRTLAERDQEAARTRAVRRSETKPAFLPVHVVDDVAAASSDAGLEVVLGDGRSDRVSPDFRVRVSTGFDAATLRRLLAVLRDPLRGDLGDVGDRADDRAGEAEGRPC